MNTARGTSVRGCAEGRDSRLGLRVESAKPHSLIVSFDDRRELPTDGTRFDRLTLSCAGREVSLGPCLFERRPTIAPAADEDDLVDDGDGHVVFTECVYDFRQLFRNGCVGDLRQKVEQLPLVWNRKSAIKPSFRYLVSQLHFDLQVYRSLFDDLDRNLEGEPYSARKHAQRLAVQEEFEGFCRFFDGHLEELEVETRGYDKQESEQHGFFFRKQLWDIILSSEFLARTNFKPRSYAGDSTMMRMIYEDEFRGPTVFSRFMHRHPLKTAAAQAVRNRCAILGREIVAAGERAAAGRARARIMSLACGPAWELRHAVRSAQDLARYELVLVDQDPMALEEAGNTISTIDAAYRGGLRARRVRESARTMIRRRDLATDWGRFALVYSMGLFDYLTRPVAKAVMAKLYELLEPGGELIVGNFHPQNATRTYMEYWMDWVLYYRTENELVELASDLDGAEVDLSYEPTGSQMLLRVRRP
jgi:extracellular factor (EF) 3-hydroxypalmitic acid methyl ester biosynthesis protein